MDGHFHGPSAQAYSQPLSVSARVLPRVGAVVLDSPASTQGWSCLAQGDSEKVKSLASLPSDTIWWLGIPYKQFFERNFTAGSGSFRHDKWFGVSQSEVLQEFGFGDIVGAGSSTAKTLATVAENITQMVGQLADSCHIPATSVLRTHSLSKGLVNLLGDVPFVPEEFRDRLEAETNPGFVKTAADRTGKRTIRFTRPRLAHAIEVLNTPVPKGTVSWARPVPSDPMSDIRRALEPVVADITISKADPRRAGLYNFNQGDRYGGMPRTTAAHPELLALDGFAVVQVHSLWAGDGYVRAIDTLPPAFRSFLRDPGCAVSWSAGVLATELLRGMMAPKLVRNGQKSSLTWRGVWLRATWRVIAFSHAFSLSRMGFMPTAYGNGWMDVQIPDDPQLDTHLLLSALQLGFLPAPGAYAPDVLLRVFSGEFGPASPDGGWGLGKFMADTALTGRGDLIRLADNAPLLDNQDQDALFARLSREMRRSA